MGQTSTAISVTPAAGLITDDFAIQATGFKAGEKVRLTSELTDSAGEVWSAEGWFVADADGVVDVHKAPSRKGTFRGLDPAGLFWSMEPSGGVDRAFLLNAEVKAHKLGQPDCDPLKPRIITLRAYTDDTPRAEATLTQKAFSDDVECFPVTDGNIRGMAFQQRDRSKSRGAIMSLAGSGGGLELGFSPILASMGYDILSLAYFAHEDLPEMLLNIPLEYFEESFEWMKRAFGAEKLAVQGISRGGELAAVLAAYLPQYVAGAIPIVPINVTVAGWDHETGEQGPSWRYKDKDIPYAISDRSTSLPEIRRLGEELPNGYAGTPEALKILDASDIFEHWAIPIEKANGPLLMISGVEDSMWPSAWASDRLMDRLRAHGYQHPYKHVSLPETGHLTPLPNSVTTFCRSVYHTLANAFYACGGTPQGSARWSRTMLDEIAAHYELVFGK